MSWTQVAEGLLRETFLYGAMAKAMDLGRRAAAGKPDFKKEGEDAFGSEGRAQDVVR